MNFQTRISTYRLSRQEIDSTLASHSQLYIPQFCSILLKRKCECLMHVLI